MVLLPSIGLRPGLEQIDRMRWLEAKGVETYSPISILARKEREDESNWEGWKQLWKLKTSQQVRVFTWIMTHGKQLTNLERWKRRLTDCLDCWRCYQGIEDLLHTVRGCTRASQIWNVLIPENLKCDFFSLVMYNLGWCWWSEGDEEKQRTRCAEKALTFCWWQWRWRNESVQWG